MIVENPYAVLALMIFAHCIADYPAQGEFLAKAKNRFNPIPGVPWYQALGAHAIIHGGFVGIITGSLVLGILEAIFHAGIDYLKCADKLSYNADQFWHLNCKILWVNLIFAFPNIW